MNFQAIIAPTISEKKILWLKNRFDNLSVGHEIWQEIVKGYTAENRFYHNLSHLYTLFKVLDETAFCFNNQRLEWAIWFHDIVYDSKRKDNEKQSAHCFFTHSKGYLNDEIRSDIEKIILSTTKHFPLDNSPEVKWMLDLDLFVLSSSNEIYQTYANAIRQEYHWVPHVLYKKGRKKVLHSFLERDRIYFSDYFYKHFEQLARTNLKNELLKLS